MRVAVQHRDNVVMLRFIDGPRAGKFASQNIGKPDEAPLCWPDAESARQWMQWQGHQENVFDAMTYLSAQTTRELMAIRDRCYKFEHSGYDVTENDGCHFVRLEQVLAVLSTREHIPNKAEARALRQAKAHAQRNH